MAGVKAVSGEGSHLVLHIPHSSTRIPEYGSYQDPRLADQQTRLFTDHDTHRIFDFPGISRLVFPHSRVWCDVERFPDQREALASRGRGLYYTHTDQGQPFRDNSAYTKVKKDYDRHHRTLEKIVQEKLDQWGHCLILDCHSFPDQPFASDLDQSPGRPDFCLGYNENQPPTRALQAREFLEHRGFSVGLNSPYSGTLVPEKYWSDSRVAGLMVEVNRRLYMGSAAPWSIAGLRDLLWAMVQGMDRP